MKDKPLYIISIVSEMLDLHPQTLRQYERLGLIKPSRTLGNTRLYSEEDIDHLKFIITLTKELGVNLAGVEIILNMRQQIDDLNIKMNKLLTLIDGDSKERMDSKAREGALIPSRSNSIIKIKVKRED